MENKNNIEIVKTELDNRYRLAYVDKCNRRCLTSFAFFSYKSAENWLNQYVQAKVSGGSVARVAVKA